MYQNQSTADKIVVCYHFSKTIMILSSLQLFICTNSHTQHVSSTYIRQKELVVFKCVQCPMQFISYIQGNQHKPHWLLKWHFIDKADDEPINPMSRDRKPRHEHITPTLTRIHWLPFRQHINYKICLTVFNALYGTISDYIKGLIRVKKAKFYQHSRCLLEQKTFGDHA